MKLVSLFNRKWKKDISLVFEKRKFKSKKSLIEEGINRGLNKDIVIEVIDFLYDYLPKLEHYAINYTDNIIEDYGIDEEDLGDFYSKILKREKIKKPSNLDQNFFFKGKNRYTVELSIQFIEWLLNNPSRSALQ